MIAGDSTVTMPLMTCARLVAALAAAAILTPIASASARPRDNATASILPSGVLQVTFEDRGVPGNAAETYTLSASGTVEYFCGDLFWGITNWGGGDWSEPLTTEKHRGRYAGTLAMTLPSTDIFTPCSVGLTRTHVRYTAITVTDGKGSALHAEPVAAGTATTG